MLHRKSITATNIDCILQKSFKIVLKDVSKGLKMTSYSRLKDAECQFDGIVVRRIRREVLNETAFGLYSLNNARIDVVDTMEQASAATASGRQWDSSKSWARWRIEGSFLNGGIASEARAGDMAIIRLNQR